MGKPTICIGENKGADQLRGNREADQRLCFRYSDSTVPLLLKSKISIFCSCTARFVSDLFENHIVGFPTSRLIHRYIDGYQPFFSTMHFYEGLILTENIEFHGYLSWSGDKDT